jgi:2-dehydro-3-deoxyphosphooctonate aldolase (KDO 8-P synthase)
MAFPYKFLIFAKNFKMNLATISNLKHLEHNNFFLLSGPCAIEGEEMAMHIAEKLVLVSDALKIPLVFKGSFKKANRSRVDSFTGIGDEKALRILRKVSETFQIPTVTDIHTNEDAEMAAQYVDVLQIPAFLVRQTDLVVAAANTGRTVNLKKGQFMSPESMLHAVTKVQDSGNDKVMVTDRGTMFGYQDMIVDFRGIPTMKSFATTVLDVTHSLQQPNQMSGVTGGRPEMIETIAKAGIATGVDGLFIETHFDPKNAKSDGANMLDLALFEPLMKKLVAIRQTINQF